MNKVLKVYHRSTSSPTKARRLLPRSTEGSQLAEFAAALMLLFVAAFIPLLDLAILPIRWMMAQELVNIYVRTLAMCESYTDSIATMEADPSLRTRLMEIGGVQVQTICLHLKLTRISSSRSEEKTLEVDKPGCIPAAWLPDGRLAPCVYSLRIDVQALISPAVLFKWQGSPIPGLTEPIPITVLAAHEWGNLGRDPSTQKYFINE